MLITVLTVSSLVMFGCAFAESIPKPSVPEFSVELAENKSIEVAIKNQPFTPYEMQDLDGHNWTVNFFYNIRIKGPFTEDWIELYNPSDGYIRQNSESEYTVRAYTLMENTDTVLGTKMIRLPDEGLIDFQVEAMIGYLDREVIIPVPGTGYIFIGETSGWSTTQTLAVGKYQPSELEVILGVAVTLAIVGAGLGFLLYLIRRK